LHLLKLSLTVYFLFWMCEVCLSCVYAIYVCIYILHMHVCLCKIHNLILFYLEYYSAFHVSLCDFCFCPILHYKLNFIWMPLLHFFIYSNFVIKNLNICLKMPTHFSSKCFHILVPVFFYKYFKNLFVKTLQKSC
jgi:hypothetical protein